MTRVERCASALAVLGLTTFVGCGGGTRGGSSATGGAGAGGAPAPGGAAGTGGGDTAGAAGTTGLAGATGAAGTTGGAGTTGAAGAGAAGTGAAGTGAAGTGAAGKMGAAGMSGAAGASADGSVSSPSACDAAGLVWKTGSKTNFTSYPAPGSAECIQYSGCLYEGQFAGCDQTEPLAWVMSHNIVAAFPDFTALKLHDLCLKSSAGKTIVVTVLDTCGDSDCNGCCTHNKGTADELIDVESFTNDRWGVSDGRIQWADLGPTKGAGCK